MKKYFSSYLDASNAVKAVRDILLVTGFITIYPPILICGFALHLGEPDRCPIHAESSWCIVVDEKINMHMLYHMNEEYRRQFNAFKINCPLVRFLESEQRKLKQKANKKKQRDKNNMKKKLRRNESLCNKE